MSETEDRAARSEVAVVGSANVDLVVAVPRRPGGGETLLGADLLRLAGGKGANQAAAAARCGAGVGFVGCVGGGTGGDAAEAVDLDADGEFLLAGLAEAGVGTAGVTVSRRPTGTAIIMLTPDGENSIVVSPGANGDLDIERAERVSAVWETARVVVLSLEIPAETVEHVAVRAAAAGARVLVNAAPATPLPPAVLGVCDPLVVNEHEARQLLGETPGEGRANSDAGGRAYYLGLAERLLEAGARSAVITLGSAGSLVVDAFGSTSVPAHRVPVVDTTGAGDAFVGAVACELARGAALADAVRFATAVAALSVQRLGAQASYADRAEVEAFLRERGANGR
ncbi:MAG: ribokinase [Leucobacter sp.]